jgi:hypothetical protein
MQLPADVFVFSDYFPKNANDRRRFWHSAQQGFRDNRLPLTIVKSTVRTRVFRSSSKWGFLFFQDNNDVLSRIVSAGCKISTFVGINDGCCEGGNYQCVHEEPFISSMLEASAEPLSYFTDHSRLLVDMNETYRRHHTFFRSHVLHRSGWEFQLRSVMVVPSRSVSRSGRFHENRIQREHVEILFPAERTRIPVHSIDIGSESSEGFELSKLTDFRVCHQEGIIAHYHVVRSQPQSL